MNNLLKKELLNIKGLRVHFNIKGQGVLHAVDGIDLDICQGEILGLVGESGCGKTVTTLSLLRLIDPPGHISNGQLNWEGKDLLNLNHKEMRQVRGKEIAMIFQNPQSSMNPLYSVGSQFELNSAAGKRTLSLLISSSPSYVFRSISSPSIGI